MGQENILRERERVLSMVGVRGGGGGGGENWFERVVERK